MTATELLLARIKATAAITAEVPVERIYDFGEMRANIRRTCIDVQLIDWEDYSEVNTIDRPLLQVAVNSQNRNEAERIGKIVQGALHKDSWSDSGYRIGAFSRGWRVFPDNGWWRAPIDLRLQIIEE